MSLEIALFILGLASLFATLYILLIVRVGTRKRYNRGDISQPTVADRKHKLH